MEKLSQVTILGVNYEVVYKIAKDDAYLKEGSSGYCDFYSKKIVIEKFTDEELNSPGATENIQALKDEIFRHEIIHAFLYESGRDDLARDEVLVNMLAIQLPKIKHLLWGDNIRNRRNKRNKRKPLPYELGYQHGHDDGYKEGFGDGLEHKANFKEAVQNLNKKHKDNIVC